VSFYLPPASSPLSLPDSLIGWLAAWELRRVRPHGSYSPTPVPPDGPATGINIGIHYDLGYQPDEDILADWAGYFPPPILRTLAAAGGLRGPTALHHHRYLPPIHLPYEDALRFFRENTVPHWLRQATRLWPRFADLPPHPQCALVSLLMHLGPNLDGPHRRELPLIVHYLAHGQTAPIPHLIRSLAHNRPFPYHHQRLLTEADLFSTPTFTST